VKRLGDTKILDLDELFYPHGKTGFLKHGFYQYLFMLLIICIRYNYKRLVLFLDNVGGHWIDKNTLTNAKHFQVVLKQNIVW